MKKKNKWKTILIALFMLPIVVFFGGCNCSSGEVQDGRNSYTVSFYTDSTNPGSFNYASQLIKHGDKVTRPSDPKKDGFTFVYWCKDKECTIPWDFNKDVVEGTITLWAKWTRVEGTT